MKFDEYILAQNGEYVRLLDRIHHPDVNYVRNKECRIPFGKVCSSEQRNREKVILKNG